MSTYDPGQQPAYTPPPYVPPGGAPQVPLDAQPTTSGDRWALIAMTVVVMTLLSCVPGLNCLLPFAPLVAGIVTLSRSKQAVDPARARTFGWIATGLGILVLLFVLALVGLYGAVIITSINQARNNPQFQTQP